MQGKAPRFDVVIQNYGNTPARQVVITWGTVLTGNAEKETVGGQASFPMNDLAPGQVVTHWATPGITIGAGDFGNLQGGLASLLFEGHVSYVTHLGAKAQTRFKVTHPFPEPGTTPFYTKSGNSIE